MSIATATGPIATAYSKALHWAWAAERRQYSHPEMAPLRLRLRAKVNKLRSLLGGYYVPHPMDPNPRQLLGKGNRFRRRFAALPKERASAETARRMKEGHMGTSWMYLTWGIPR